MTGTGATSTTRFAIEGRVVTMDAAFTVLETGKIYVGGDSIVAVSDAAAPPPAGYENVSSIATGGTIYPGLIDLHNHLSYDALTLWNVPKRYTNRDQWSGGAPDYLKLISGPMSVLGRTSGYPEAIVRYVECKCLLGGVATSQGIALFSNAGIVHYYRGLVRNVEQTDTADLPEAATQIGDVEARDASKFLARLEKSSCLLLHLAEGTDTPAHHHFESLHLADGTWALTPALAGIHCVALTPADFGTVHEHGSAMIWSPLSNLLLYGQTANVQAAKEHGVPIGIGPDWSPSGSKNLLGELKVARLVSQAGGGTFSDRELLAMATRVAAQIVHWDGVLGSIEPGKRADLLVIEGAAGDPYATLFSASETSISLVVINGVARLGSPELMGLFGAGTETRQVGSVTRVLNLSQQTADPVVGKLSLADAEARLADGLHRLPELAKALEEPTPPTALPDLAPRWFLVLDHDEPPGIALRPHLPYGPEAGPAAMVSPLLAARAPLSQILTPLALDPLTVPDDPTFLQRIAQQPNLPAEVAQGLASLYP